jgi:hypothetical protein
MNVSDSPRMFLTLVIVLCLLVCARVVAADGEERVQAPVYAIPGSWTFRTVDRTYAGMWKSNLLNGDFEITMRDGAYRIGWVDGGKSPDTNEFCPLGVMLPTPDANRASPQYFNFPLWVGKKWKGSELVQRHWRNTDSVVTGIEEVVTPAGTFVAYRIERYIVLLAGITTYHLTQVYFYSPETRSTVKYECDEDWRDLQGNFALQEKIQIELTGYKTE